ncbi:MAG: FAD-dependent monooxygenase, partial [Variovorax sp.]
QDAGSFAAALQAGTQGALGTFQLVSERAAWPLQRAIAERWIGCFPSQPDGNGGLAAKGLSGKAWALAGDAAHTVHPLAGQGLNMGLADVLALTDILKKREYWRSVGDARLLRRYERARRPDILSMSLATDGLQQLFSRRADASPASGALAAARNWGMRGFDRSGVIKRWVARHAMGL